MREIDPKAARISQVLISNEFLKLSVQFATIFKMSLLAIDFLGNITTTDNGFTLSTGADERAAFSLGLFTVGDREFLKQYDTEGSSATISNLNTGVYSFD